MEDFKNPESEQELEKTLKRVQDYSEKLEFGDALVVCQYLILNKATRLVGFRERAEVWQNMKRLELAIEDMKKVVSLGSVEPVDYYNLGIAQLKVGETEDAINLFTKAIDISNEHDSHYYTQSCYFHRAAAYLRLGVNDKVIEDCMLIEDGYKCFLPSEGIMTKEELLSKARRVVGIKGVGDK